MDNTPPPNLTELCSEMALIGADMDSVADTLRSILLHIQAVDGQHITRYDNMFDINMLCTIRPHSDLRGLLTYISDAIYEVFLYSATLHPVFYIERSLLHDAHGFFNVILFVKFEEKSHA